MSYINFKTMSWHGCINLENNDLYLTHVSPRYRRKLSCKHITYNVNDVSIDKEVHEAVKNLARNFKK